MSPLQVADRLDEFAGAIRRLRVEVVEHERDAHESLDDAASAKAFMARAQLDEKLHAYFELSEQSRDRTCPVHNVGFVSACPDCRRLAERRSTAPAPASEGASCRVAPSTTISIHGHERHVPLMKGRDE